MRPVNITKVMNGFVVNVGCQTLVFNDRALLITELNRYLERPDEIEKEYLERFGMRGRTGREEPPLTLGGVPLDYAPSCTTAPTPHPILTPDRLQ